MKCIGCGSDNAKRYRGYCRKCQHRVYRGLPVDMDDCPTERDLVRLRIRMRVFGIRARAFRPVVRRLGG